MSTGTRRSSDPTGLTGRDRRRDLDLAGHCTALLLERRDPDAIRAGSTDRSVTGARGRPERALVGEGQLRGARPLAPRFPTTLRGRVDLGDASDAPAQDAGGITWRRGDDDRSARAVGGCLAKEWIAHQSPVFVPNLLADPTITLLGGYRGDAVVAGCAGNRSADAVGFSNFFVEDGEEPLAVAGAIAEVARFGVRAADRRIPGGRTSGSSRQASASARSARFASG